MRRIHSLTAMTFHGGDNQLQETGYGSACIEPFGYPQGKLREKCPVYRYQSNFSGMLRRLVVSVIVLLISFMGSANIAGAVPVVSYTNNYDSGPNLWTYEAAIFNDTSDLLYDFVIYPTANPIGAADLTSEGWGAADAGHVAPDYFVHLHLMGTQSLRPLPFRNPGHSP